MVSRGPVAVVVAVVVAAGVVAGSCGGSDERLVVFGASSLTDVLDEIARQFEIEHPGVEVVVNVAGSSTLVAQLADGAPADVLATADRTTMESARRELDGEPVVFARNQLVIAVEAGNPLGITELADLSAPGTVVVLAAPEVPAGRYAEQVIGCADVDLDVASYEQSVRSAAAKVGLGEADASIVYRTDVDDDLAAVGLDPGCDVSAEYLLAVVRSSGLAAEFVDLMTGPVGRSVLRTHGFEVP